MHPSVGRFVVLDLLREGGAGAVHRAYDSVLRREVALKLVRTSSGHADAAEEVVREAQAMAQLTHRNVVGVYDVVVDVDRVVIAMEYVRGQTLRTWLDRAPEEERRRRPWRAVIEVFTQAALGLAAAHQVGLVHRDFKPGNVLMADDGRVLVADFGIAKVELGASGQLEEASEEAICGTPEYMAPEQHDGRTVDARCDQYSFCVALWEALCGASPFAGIPFDALPQIKREGPPPWPRHVRLPPGTIAAIVRGLAPAPELRWPTMQALLHALLPTSRARAVGWTASAFVIPVIGVASWTWHSGRSARCSGGESLLSSVWHADDRAAVHAALVRTGLTYAPETAVRVLTALDDYAEGWKGEYRSACEATVLEARQSHFEMELRMMCLHRRKIELHSAVELLRMADAAVLEKAVHLATSLPSLSRCTDIEALRAEVPPPEDPQTEASVEQARVLLAEASAQEQAGLYRASLAKLEAAEAIARGLAYAPVHAELAYRRGALLSAMGQYSASEKSYELAQRLGLESGLLALAAEATAALASVVGQRQTRLDEGALLADVGLELALTRGLADDIEARARMSMAAVRHAQGRYREAEEQCRRVLAVREKDGTPGPVLAELHGNLGLVLVKQSRHAEAEAELRRSLLLRHEALGAEHPKVADAHKNLGVVLWYQGRFEEAEREYRQALALHEKAYGQRHPYVAASRHTLGMTLRSRGQLEEAEVELRNALSIYEKLPQIEHQLIADCRETLAGVFFQQGRLAAAETEIRRVLEAREKALGPKHAKVMDALQNLAQVIASRGDHREAERLFRRVRGLLEESLGPHHSAIADASSNLATVLSAQNRDAEAETEYRAALALYEQTLGLQHPHTAMALAGLGQMLARRGDTARARAHLEQAVASTFPEPLAEAEAKFTLAKLLWSIRKERPRALELAERARDRFHAAGRDADAHELTQWLAERGRMARR